MDMNFLTLTYLDSESLIEEVMRGDLTSFVKVARTVLDMGGRIADDDFIVEDDPLSKALDDKKGKSSSFLYPKPLKASTSKITRR